jgi:ligand-binding SRPBCC domain-containing protein
MPIIKLKTFIKAPIDMCFDLARNVEIHTKTTSHTNERAVGGVTTGLLKKGDEVIWEAIHLGIKQRLTAKISEMDEPYTFTDVMVKGAFHSFTHIHSFVEKDNGTIMKDYFEYQSPFGIIGQLADKLFLEKYMRNFLVSRANELKKIAEIETIRIQQY